MKKYVSILVALLAAGTVCVHAQTDKSNFKFGKPSKEDLSMTSCSLDPDADKVIIFEHYDYAIETSNNGLYQKRTITRRIKVLSEDGVDAGDITIDLFRGESATSENLVKLEAVAVNVDENGKTVSTQLKNNMIFKENVSSSLQRVKASIPEVKKGTVIDCRFTISSDNIVNIPTIYLQHSVPVLFSEADVHMPDFIVFYVDYNEVMHPIIKDIAYKERKINSGGEAFSYSERWLKGMAVSVPPVKKEPFVWNISDFKSSMSFELKSVEYPGMPAQSFSYTWEDVFKTLNDADSFGGNLKMSNPLKDEVAKAVSGKENDRDRIKAVLDLLSSRVTWDESYALTSSNPKNALKTGKGSSADINFLLMAMLSDIGIKSTPVLLNPKDIKNFSNYPTLKDINYFILSVKVDDGGIQKEVFLDGTDKWSSIDVIPDRLLSFKAIRFNEPEPTRSVNLSTIGKGAENHILKAVINDEGSLESDFTMIYSGLNALVENGRVDSFGSEDEYFESLMDDSDVDCLSGTMTRERDRLVTNLKFKLNGERSGDILYLKPTLVDILPTDLFTADRRTLPIDLNHPFTISFRAMVMLGDKWVLEGVPQSSSFSMGDKEIVFNYKALKGNGMVQIVMEFKLNGFYYTVDRYEDLRNFWNSINNVLEGRIALKKVS